MPYIVKNISDYKKTPHNINVYDYILKPDESIVVPNLDTFIKKNELMGYLYVQYIENPKEKKKEEKPIQVIKVVDPSELVKKEKIVIDEVVNEKGLEENKDDSSTTTRSYKRRKSKKTDE